MNVFIPLFTGVLIGYALRNTGKKPDLERLISVVLLLMVFFLGVKTGEVQVNGFWLLGVSTIFALMTAAGSLLLALGVGR